MPILAILLVFLNMHSLGTSACPIHPMQKKKNPGHPYRTFFTGLLATLSTQLIFLVLVCMYLLPHVCMQNIFDLPDV